MSSRSFFSARRSVRQLQRLLRVLGLRDTIDIARPSNINKFMGKVKYITTEDPIIAEPVIKNKE
jgi:hypothetical protein